MKRLVRKFCSWLYRSDASRVMGVSFVIAVKNEPKTIRACLVSLLPFADEILVVDASTDETSDKIKLLAQAHEKIRHIQFFCDDKNGFALQWHIGLVCSRFHWIFKFGGDMIAAPGMSLWIERLKKLPANRFYVVDLPHVNILEDLSYQPLGREFVGAEGMIFTFHPSLRWILKPGHNEQPVGDHIYGKRLPFFYQVLSFREPYIFHVDLKGVDRWVKRYFWSLWLKSGSQVSLEEFIAAQPSGVVAAVRSQVKKKKLRLYDAGRFGQLPEVFSEIEDNSICLKKQRI